MTIVKLRNLGRVNAILRRSAFCLVFCSGSIWAQSQSSQANNSEESWTATAQTSIDNTNPSRTNTSHTKTKDRTVDTQRVEVLGPDGRYQPDFDTEKETIQVDATTTRTVERTYKWDTDGKKKLAFVTEEEAQTSANGDIQVTRTISNSDVNEKLQVVQRDIANTKKTGPDTQETKTMVYFADGNGGFTMSRQMQEAQKRGANNAVEVKQTTLLPDGNGKWAVGEVRNKTIQNDGSKRTTEEQVSRPDLDGRVSEQSRTILHESQIDTGESSRTVDTYSTMVPGEAGDGRLHLNQRVTTIQKRGSDTDSTEQQIEQPAYGNPNGSLQTSAKTKYTVHYASPGTNQTKTDQTIDGKSTPNAAPAQTQQSDQAHPGAVTSPSDKP